MSPAELALTLAIASKYPKEQAQEFLAALGIEAVAS